MAFEKREASQTRILQEEIRRFFNAPFAGLLGGILVSLSISFWEGSLIRRLKKSEKWLKEILENAAVGVIEASCEDFRITYANPRLCALLGHSKEQLRKMTVMDITAPEDLSATFEVTSMVREEKRAIGTYEKRYLKSDGSRIWVRVNISGVKKRFGEVCRYIATVEDISAQKESEEALAGHRDRLTEITRLLEYAPVMVRDMESRITLWNRGMTSMYGYTPEEAMGQQSHLLLKTVFPQPLPEIMEILIAYGRWHGELRHTTRDGRQIVVATLWVLHESAGKRSIIQINNDVTQLKEAQEATRNLEENLRFATEAAALGTWHWDLLTGDLTWSDRCKEIFGLPMESRLSHQRFLELIHPEDRQRVDLAAQRALQDKKDYREEMRIPLQDGEIRWIVSRGRAHFDNGRATAMHGVVIEITERKMAEERLRESEQQFRTLAEALPHFVWIADANGLQIYFNLRWYEYTGAGPEESMGLKWAEYLHPDDRERLLDSWNHSLRTGYPLEAECRFRRMGGTYEWFIARALPIRDNSGNISRWFGTCTGIEEQVKARKAAEAAALAKSSFMANMSHEIRTPLNGILGMTDLLLDTSLDPLQRRYLEMVRSSGESLLTVVNDVLDFSKLEAGVLALDIIEFDLRETVEKPADTLSIQAFQKGLEVTVFVAPELPDYFLGDPAKIRQVILNLVSNAVKFTEKGEVKIRVEGAPLDEEFWDLKFSVTDTGIGIPEDKLEMIFRSFTQIDETTVRKYGGTGLGLAISREIAEEMGGSLTVESKVGAGSTFSFLIRLKKAVRQPEEGAARFGDLSDLRALVLDDNATNLYLMERWLNTLGIEVTTAATGREAVRSALGKAETSRPFDLIFIDMHLPDIDGFEVAGMIRERLSIENVCIMMITSDDIAGGARRARDLGMAAYLVKPIRFSSLKQALAQVRAPSDEMLLIRNHDLKAPEPSVRALYCLRVLVVEDNPVNLTLTETILGKAGVKVTRATNGTEAVDLCEEGRFHLVLMDVQMPVMDGFTATGVLRSKGVTTPIIGLTAHALQGDRERCLEAGMNDYIPKPFTGALLLEKISFWTGGFKLPPVRQEKLLDEVDGDLEDFNLLKETYLKSIPVQVADIEKAIEDESPKELEAAAHRMKGSLGFIAAEDARCLAEELEKAGMQGDISKARELCLMLEKEAERILVELQDKKNI